jgi:hypothetical protein
LSQLQRHGITVALACGLLLASHRASAAEHYGQVSFTGLAIPGVTVTASQGAAQTTTSTDAQGVFHLPMLDDGLWTIRVEMVGFASLEREVTVGPETPSSTWELTLLSFEEITRDLPAPTALQAQAEELIGGAAGAVRVTNPTAVPDAGASSGGFQRAGVTAAPVVAAAVPVDAEPIDASLANDGFLINGSVNNGAASPFAQPAAFGNNRLRRGGLYNGTAGLLASSSVWDARPFSLTGFETAQPDYNNVHFLATFGGPLRLPGTRSPMTFFVGYQRTSDDTSRTQPALMPSALERLGNFSGTRDAQGRPVQVVDPLTGQPFPGGVIPPGRISPQARALLGYYPGATIDEAGGFNYETGILSARRQDSVQARLAKTITTGSQLQGTLGYQHSSADGTSLFGFDSRTRGSGLDTQLTYTSRFGFRTQLRATYQFTRQTSESVPYFADRLNVSGQAGIGGNNQDPENWGPPSLVFSSGLAGLSDANPQRSQNLTHGGGAEIFMSRGRHNLTLGGNLRRSHVNILSQRNPRGTFTFSGTVTGSDFADFLLGLPSASAIASGSADTFLRGTSVDTYITDDWRIGPGLTVTAGVRWEYESPFTESEGRLVNLDVASGFTDVSQVLPGSPVGGLTGRAYPAALLRSDWGGLQPRLAMAWRPVPGSSLVVRAGYGIYRNTGIYQSIATQMTQQAPFATTLTVASTPDNPLTLANGFTAPLVFTPNTFAVDPDFRVGSSHNWQVSLQRDLPYSLTVSASYLGTRGTGLVREFLPNTYPTGAVNPCPDCPAGFVYLTSGGRSSRHAAQLLVRRRLRGGFTATTQYTLARALDDAASFAGANLSGTVFAQDWLDLGAEYGPSSFDRRHEFTVQLQYTTGVGVAGGALIDGWQGALLKGWTLAAQLRSGSGLPLTPYVLRPVAGTGYTGSVRASLTGASTDAPGGYYVNPAAYTVPAPGEWGNAGRNSARGPADFSLDGGITRSFRVSGRNVDFRIDATNILNRVTYSAVNTLVGSPQFGLPTAANQMRRFQTSLRVGF